MIRPIVEKFARLSTAQIIGIFILLDIALATIFGLSQSLLAPINHMDGAFQTSSVLYRIDAGQVPGRDFFSYLGIGVMYLLYPVFYLAGGTASASVFAMFFMAALLATFSITINLVLIAKPRNSVICVAVASLALAIAILAYPTLPQLTDRFTPGNSLRPLRSALPYICAILLYATVRSSWLPSRTYACIGAIAGISFLWLNEFCVPTAFGIGLFGLGYAVAQRQCRMAIPILIFSAVVTLTLVLTLLTHGHGIALLKYNFLDVAGDQYWYFASWMKEVHIYTLSDMYTKSIRYVDPAKWMLLVVAGLFLCKPTIEHALLLFIGSSLFLGGELAVIGGHFEHGYFAAFIFWCKLTFVGIFVHAFIYAIQHIRIRVQASRDATRTISVHVHGWYVVESWPHLSFIFRRAIGVGVCVAAIFLCGVLITKADKYRIAHHRMAKSPDYFYAPELGGYLPVMYKPYVELARTSNQKAVVEEYWGLWHAITHQLSPYPTDSVISALGEKREIFARDLEKTPPDYFISSSERSAGPWIGWNMSASWWFYKILLQDYTPQRVSLSTYRWSKNTAVTPWPVTACHIDRSNPNDPRIVLGTDHVGYYEITLDYDAHALSRRTLLMVQNNMVFATYMDGYLSLDPRRKESVFPAALINVNAPFHLRLVGKSDGLAQLQVTACHARQIMFEHPSLLPSIASPSSMTPANLTDANWLFGVARNGTAFFVPNTENARKLFVVGRKMEFSEGLVNKHITRVEQNGAYLNVFLDGDPLDGSNGFPHPFKVVE